MDTLEFNKIDTEGKQWEVSGTVLASQNGNASFSIEVLDLAGNKGSPVTVTDDNTQVVLDNTPPTLTSVVLASNNPETTQAKEGDKLSLSLISDEPIELSQVTLAGNNNPDINDISDHGTEWEVSTLVDQNTPENQATFSVAFNDKAGNQGTTQTSTKDRSSVNIDTTPTDYGACPVAVEQSDTNTSNGRRSNHSEV